MFIETGFKYNLPTINKIRSMATLGVKTRFALKDQPNNLLLMFQASKIIKENYFTLIDSYNPHFDTCQ